MTFPFTCRACGHLSQAEWSQVGQTIPCGGCGKPLTVPAPRETAGAAAEPAPLLRFACPACGRKFVTKAALAGKKIRCSGCGAGVRVTLGAANAVARPSRPALMTFGAPENATDPPQAARGRAMEADGEADDSSSQLYDLESIEEVQSPQRAEPVLPSRSGATAQARQQVAGTEAVETPKNVETAKKKKKKRKKKKSGYFDPKDTLILVGGVGAFVAVLAGLAWAYPGLRFPLGGLLCVIGFIVYLLGAFSLRQLVAEEGAFKALLFRFFPPYQLWFVATHWAETKDFVSLFASGLIILAIGGAVLKTSPISKNAEEAERAYQKARQDLQPQVPPALREGPAGDGI
jgi:hypothetical protein